MRLLKPLLLAAAVVAALAGPSQKPVRAQVRPLTITTSSTASADLRTWDTTVDRMRRDGSLRLRATIADTMMPGRVTERMDQFYNGVPVWDADVARQLDEGVTVSIFGVLYDDIDVDVEPTLSPDDAKRVVERLAGVPLGDSRMPQLLILPDEGSYRLAYRAVAFTEQEGYEYFLDANTGAIVRQYSAIQRQTAAVGRGKGVFNDDKKVSASSAAGTFTAQDLLRPPNILTYDMRGNLTRVINFLNGVTPLLPADLAQTTDNVWTDGPVVDAHAYGGLVYDYYFKRFGRHGLNNNDIQLTSIVHPVRREDLLRQPVPVVGLFYVNAFYAGRGIMVYGEGLPPGILVDGQAWNYLAGGLDVIGHELTHGVTDYSSRLPGSGEGGALNEAFSDIMGTSIEFYYQPAGSGQLKADYEVGEDVVTPGGIRSMDDPGAFGDPDNYASRYTGPLDNGGVHTNAGIGDQAYYLAIEGGTNRTSGLTVQGVGGANREQIEKIFYRGFVQLLPSSATYAIARAATIQAARDLYGAGSAAERAITQAWTAVGVN